MSTSVSMNDIIQGARVQGALRGAHVTPATGLQICWGDDVPAGTGSSIVIPRLAAIAVPAGTKTEAGEFDLVESSTDGETLTSGWVGYTDRVSDELSYDATEDATVLVVQHGLEWLGNRVDADLMTIGASFPTDSDFTDLALTQSRFLEAQADFKANLPVPGMSAGAFGLQQMADLKADLASNGGSHFGGDVASQQLKELLDLSFGYEGALYGQAVFSSANVVDAGSNNSGFMCKMGEMGALAYRVWVLPGVEYERIPRRKAWELTIAIRYGVAISDPANGHVVTSKSVAA